MITLEYVGLGALGAAIVTALLSSSIPQQLVGALQSIIGKVTGLG
jgi:hypothetical protein